MQIAIAVFVERAARFPVLVTFILAWRCFSAAAFAQFTLLLHREQPSGPQSFLPQLALAFDDDAKALAGLCFLAVEDGASKTFRGLLPHGFVIAFAKDFL